LRRRAYTVLELDILVRDIAKRCERIPAECIVALDLSAGAGIPIARAEMRAVKPYPPVYKGVALSSWRTWREDRGADTDIALYNDSKHLKYIEFGVSGTSGGSKRPFGPHSKLPPLSKILPWVREKLAPPEEVERLVANKLRRKLVRDGIQPRNVLLGVHKKVSKVAGRELLRALKRVRDG